jgi:polyisoprenoid-binding protein YceI
MMKSTTLKLTFLAIAFFGTMWAANAQKNYELNKKQTFSVLGTSTLHDWEMVSSTATGTANLTITNSKLEEINGITINLLSESIKSDKNAMDKIAYKTLKTNKFKTIKYVLKTAEKANETTWDLTGTFTIAGVSKELKTQVKTTVNNGTITLQGSNKITFEDFGMTAPTALFGTIKTGKELTLRFNINFN